MKKISMLAVALVMLPVLFAQSLSYSVSIHYESGKLALGEVSLVQVSPSPALAGKEYTAKIISHTGHILYETSFAIETSRVFAPSDIPEISQMPEETTLNLLLPYFANAGKIAIEKGGAVLLEIDVSMFSVCNENALCEGTETAEICPSDCTCGNGACDAPENYRLCSSDCASGSSDNYCDTLADGICDPDCSAQEDSDCKKEPSAGNMLYLLLGLALAGVVGGVAILVLRKRKK